MFPPVYNRMDSYPQPHPHQYYPNNYYPAWSQGYPAPMEYHSCCNHAYPPPPPPPHCHTSPPIPHGPYPFYAGSAYPPYHIPPHFFMENPSPRYEYDKEMHCCGCPNHVCQSKQQNKGVRIKEHEPETANMKDSDALAPAKFKGEYPSPHVWFPPEYVEGKDGTKVYERGADVWNGWCPIGLKNDKDAGDKSSLKAGDTKAKNDPSNEDHKAPFPLPMFWFPGYNRHRLEESRNKDMKNDKGSKGETASESAQKHADVKANDQNNAPFPFPVFWFPDHDRLQENKDVKASDSNPQLMEERQPKLKIIPVNSPGNNDRKETVATGDRYGDGVGEKVTEVSNDLHVQPNGETGRSESPEVEKRPKEIHVTQVKQDEKEEPCGKYIRSQSSSPRKASKLPPVCLRVDPLPRRKSGGGGTSRSPSPPAVKSKVCQDGKSCLGQVQTRSEEAKARQDIINQPMAIEENVQPNGKSCLGEVQTKSEEAKARPDIINQPMAIEEHVQPNGNEVPRKCEHVPIENVDSNASIKEVPVTQATDIGEVHERESASQGNEISETVSNMPLEDSKTKQKLSTTEAAVVIQSFYRGFQIRKWQPLNKLKQIAKVRDQVNEIGARVRTLESSFELRKDEKQRILIGEAIMSLLLQLDTVQGLHPTVRDIRKSVAKELTSLQEKLDSLFSLSAAEEHVPELTNMQQAPSALNIGGDVGGVKLECVERKPIDTEHQLKVEEQFPDLAEMESTEKAAGADEQLAIENQFSTELRMETEPRSDTSSKPTEKVEESDQQLPAENNLSALLPTENESRCNSLRESSEKEEEANQQLLGTDEASGEADQQLSDEDKLYVTLPRNDCPPVSVDKAEEADQQIASTKFSSSCKEESEKDCHLTSQLDVRAIQVTGEALGDDRKASGEPGCCHGIVKFVEGSGVEVREMTGEAPISGVEKTAEPTIIVMDDRAGSGLQTPESTKARNPHDSNPRGESRSAADGFMDPFTVDIVSKPVAGHMAEEMPEVLDEIPLCKEDGLENNLQESTIVRNAENESGSGDPVLASRVQALNEVDVGTSQEMQVCPMRKEDNVDEQHCFDNDEDANMRGTCLMDEETREDMGGGAGKGEAVVVDKQQLSKENENLRDVLGKLIEEGEKQMKVISDLNGRIKELERKLTKKRMTRRRASAHLKQSV